MATASRPWAKGFSVDITLCLYDICIRAFYNFCTRNGYQAREYMWRGIYSIDGISSRVTESTMTTENTKRQESYWFLSPICHSRIVLILF